MEEKEKNLRWINPPKIYGELNAEFCFTLDGCKAGIASDWTGETVWCNPPLGKNIEQYVAKAACCRCTTVLLLPARTDSRWFHRYVYRNPAADVRFIRGRLKYLEGGHYAPFASMIVVFNKKRLA